MNLLGKGLDTLSYIAALLMAMSPLVFLHEAGHFFTARSFGIRVYTFSFGFGWRLFGFQRRDGRLKFSIGPLRRRPTGADVTVGTDYRVSAIPFGGYVMLQGESLSEPLTGDKREFRTRPRWQQQIVFGAGVALNILLAFALWTGYFYKLGSVIEERTDEFVIQAVVPGSAAEIAGIRPGDKLLQIEGQDAHDEMVLFKQITLSAGETRTFLIERAGVRKSIPVMLGTEPVHHMGDPGFTVDTANPTIAAVGSGGPAAHAGILPGDRIVHVGDIADPTRSQILALIQASVGSPLKLEVERGGKRVEVAVTPEKREGVGVIDVHLTPGRMREIRGIADAAVQSARECWQRAAFLFVTLRELFRGNVSPRMFAGPLELGRTAKETWREGGSAFAYLLAFVSLQLGILNLLPIPGLDGGHMFILLIEGTIRRTLPDALREWVMLAGLAVIVLFSGVVIFFDFVKAWL